jgi:hypothetical protein
MRRGRPPRAGRRATKRIEVTLTPAELRRVKRLARVNGCTVADLLRLALLTMVADLAEGADPIVVLADRVGPVISAR